MACYTMIIIVDSTGISYFRTWYEMYSTIIELLLIIVFNTAPVTPHKICQYFVYGLRFVLEIAGQTLVG